MNLLTISTGGSLTSWLLTIVMTTMYILLVFPNTPSC